MPGQKGRSGRKPKPTAEHIAKGTYRKHRHASRAENHVANGKPIKPGHLGNIAAEAWDVVIGNLPEASLCKLDASSLAMFCELLELYHLLLDSMKSDPLDKDTRITFFGVVDRIDKIGRQFGWSPQARASLSLPESQPDDDPLIEFIKNRVSDN